MRTVHATIRNCHSPVLNAKDARSKMSRLTKLVIVAGCLVTALISTATTASAHVKWFVDCNVSDDPLPAQAVLTPTFLVFFTLFLVLLFLGCAAERTASGCLQFSC